ncbi:MAG: hypothetical protein R3D57_14105 [Hyphomicrobiaceae bacterium]
MSATAFEKFTEAVAAQGRPASPAAVPELRKVTVLGGGPDARMLAALCLAEGAEVTLFSAYGAELDGLKAAGGVTLRGQGPVGTFQINQPSVPSITTTAEIDRAVQGADLIFLTGPVHKQRTYAMVLADHVRDGQVLVVAPGRSLGAVEAAWLLRVGGAKADVTLVEVQGLPYWHSANGSVLGLTAAGPAWAATLPSNRSGVLEALKRYLPNILPAVSPVHSGFADGSGLVEVPALVLGGPAVPSGRKAIPLGGVPLAENENFRVLIGDGHLTVMAEMAEERHRVAQRFGVRNLPSLDDWLDIHAGTTEQARARPIPAAAQATAIVRCATIGSLVPLASAARVAGVEAKATEAMVALVSSLLGSDIAKAGRRLETIGVTADHIDDARQLIDAIANGSR